MEGACETVTDKRIEKKGREQKKLQMKTEKTQANSDNPSPKTSQIVANIPHCRENRSLKQCKPITRARRRFVNVCKAMHWSSRHQYFVGNLEILEMFFRILFARLVLYVSSPEYL